MIKEPSTARVSPLGFVLAATLFLSACGFQPLYSQKEGKQTITAELHNIDVVVKGDRLAQMVYSDLQSELSPTGAAAIPAYQLDVRLSKIKKGVGFEEDDSVTRFNFQLIGDYRLIDNETGKEVFRSTSRSIAAYNVVTNQFATLTAEKDAEKRASADLAHDIKLQLSLHFRAY